MDAWTWMVGATCCATPPLLRDDEESRHCALPVLECEVAIKPLRVMLVRQHKPPLATTDEAVSQCHQPKGKCNLDHQPTVSTIRSDTSTQIPSLWGDDEDEEDNDIGNASASAIQFDAVGSNLRQRRGLIGLQVNVGNFEASIHPELALQGVLPPSQSHTAYAARSSSERAKITA
eukprot:CAMPEP_0206593372 /NCGR_PEP_ID=MMETSP0325_2-20121206/41617_1 /ASSEMBLY_ACC=CAM_ASM_000347 /TAXON_ID=2866 /ORGANISM="Crypthecodinium cohnii, Strain Seligo" /LENGTH=174 /DNA_ID=CAMNT_0054103385 /DNA_START=55 /DNA_END=579 /DNA_ORIENTATION=-